jgi:hypothetical protein
MNKYAYKMGYVPYASELKEPSSNSSGGAPEGVISKDMALALSAQCAYVRTVADAAVRSIDDMVTVCAAVYRNAIEAFEED